MRHTHLTPPTLPATIDHADTVSVALMAHQNASHAISIEVAFPLSVYSVEAVKRAAYAFMARAVCDIQATNSEMLCKLTVTSSSENIETLERDFKREVLDQDLRISIEQQTEPMRNAILGFTFSKTGLQG